MLVFMAASRAIGMLVVGVSMEQFIKFVPLSLLVI
jgi:hypothetical protein